jgi:cytidylate kinase
VRTKCVADQQKIAMGQSCVMEGRDTTTVVLPNATLKIYLTASLDIRAERR